MNSAIHKATLLCVDDEPNILSALRRVFRSKGYQVLVAGSGDEGLDTLAHQPVDLVISDMRMPGMNGAQFLAQVAERWPMIMRLLLTGYAEVDAAIDAVNSGHIYGYYSKPWEDMELCLAVENAIRQKRLSEEKEHLLKELTERNQQLKTLNANLDKEVQVRTLQLQTALGKIKTAHQELKRQYSDTVRVFSRFVGLREGSFTGHARRVAERAQTLAKTLGMSAEEQQDLLFAGLLSQVGKLTLADRLVNTPLNLLKKSDRDSFMQHAATAGMVLKEIGTMQRASGLIAQQFEAYDGSGVPGGVAGEEIPLGARILAVVRDYDLYLEGRITGHPMSACEAQDQLRRLRKKKYDPAVVDALLTLVGKVKDSIYRPVLEATPQDLIPGMEIVEILYGDRVFLREVILTPEMIREIQNLDIDLETPLNIKVRGRK